MGFFKKITEGLNAEGTFRIGSLGSHPSIIVNKESRQVTIVETAFTQYNIPIDNLETMTIENKGITYFLNVYVGGTLAHKIKCPSAIKQKVLTECLEYIKSLKINDQEMNNSESITDKIKKLAELKDQGILTQEEFDNKKSELLEKF